MKSGNFDKRFVNVQIDSNITLNQISFRLKYQAHFGMDYCTQ